MCLCSISGVVSWEFKWRGYWIARKASATTVDRVGETSFSSVPSSAKEIVLKSVENHRFKTCDTFSRQKLVRPGSEIPAWS